tara:strand:- start:433 stop:792 length:360 start_codon:yes stop_codon:yes gene_type:complete
MSWQDILKNEWRSLESYEDEYEIQMYLRQALKLNHFANAIKSGKGSGALDPFMDYTITRLSESPNEYTNPKELLNLGLDFELVLSDDNSTKELVVMLNNLYLHEGFEETDITFTWRDRN